MKRQDYGKNEIAATEHSPWVTLSLSVWLNIKEESF